MEKLLVNTALISVACAALLLSGCSATGGTGGGRRVPANPPEFTISPPPDTGETQALAAERDALARTVIQLRGEVDQLRKLFRLQHAPLDSEPRNSDALVQDRPGRPVSAAPANATAMPEAASGSTAARTTPAPQNLQIHRPVSATNYTALFRLASASLDDTSRAALEALAPQLRSAARVTLQAFADTTGDAGVNSMLAQARGAAVERELLTLGVPKERIATEAAVADSRPPAGATILGLFRSPEAIGRRVDLALVHRDSAR